MPDEDSRSVLLAAAARLISEQGAGALTVEGLVERAGVSSAVFQATFADRTDLLLAVFDDAVERARAAMLAAYRAADCWVDGVRGALYRLLEFFDADPDRARLLLLGSLTGEQAIRTRRERILAELARGLDHRRPEGDRGSPGAPFGADAVVAAAAAVIHGRLLEDPMPPLRPLGSSLMAVIVLPYLGVGGARGEVARKQDALGEPASSPGFVEVAGVRLSARMLTLLESVARQPGMSNREVAVLGGIAGSGQASRLLCRLRDLGLLVGEAGRAGRKAWRITPSGLLLLERRGAGAAGSG